MRAVDRATGATLKHGGSECVARYDIKRATWSRQRFGSCGVRPLHVSQIPTAVCVSAAGGSTGGKAVSQPPTAPPSPEPGTTPVDQQPPSPSPAPAQDGSGSSSSPPPATPEPSPSPDAPALSSPVPLQRTGPVLPRISVLEGETVPNGVRRIEAVTADGAVVTSGLPVEQQVVVGICDSGIDATHPDLNYFGGQSFGLTAGTNDASPDIDAYGHGTHVSGIIAAKNNGAGVIGVSPGTPLFSLKVLDGSGRGSLSSVIAAMAWVATEGIKTGIRVVNLSLAAYIDPTSPDYAATRDAVCGVFAQASAAGVLVTTAAGNYGSSIRGYLPAACSTVAAVTAVDNDGSEAASYSNFLSTAEATPEEMARMIAAPGTDIMSTISFLRDASGYKTLSGTSMAAPHIAAIAANCLMAGACPMSGSGMDTLATVQAAAQERLTFTTGAPSYGFAGDATSTDNGKYFGLLAWAKW